MLKATIFHLLEGVPRTTSGQRIFDALLISLILANVLAIILSTVQPINEQYGRLLFNFELFSVFVFTLELMLRFWLCDISADSDEALSRWRFWSNPYILVDMLAILPFYLGSLISVDLRLLRLLRLLRVFRISPYFRSLSLLGSVIKQEYRPMLSALAVIAILILFVAAGIFLLERQAQPEAFGDLPSALWWVVVTLSTVGYGDAVPVTTLGRMLGAVIMILGVGMVALPAGMLASRFSEVMHRQQDIFQRFVEENIETGGAISDELVELRRQELFISRAEAKSIIDNCIEDSQQARNFCPNCGSKLSSRKKA